VTHKLTNETDKLNFLIGGDGNVYEYLGFNLTTFRNSKFKDFFFFFLTNTIFVLSKEMKVKLLIGFIGHFENLLPSDKMGKMVNMLTKNSTEKEWLQVKYPKNSISVGMKKRTVLI
jgi:hypothetical protein